MAMSIVSLKFSVFLAVVFALYFAVPLKYRWTVLLAASWVFYWINSGWLIAVLILDIGITFFFGRWIGRIYEKGETEINNDALTKKEKKAAKARIKSRGKHVMTAGILLNLSMLLVLKYFNFFSSSANSVLGKFGVGFQLPMLNLLLPLGISFYTLQAIAYLADIYRQKIKADTSFFKFALFMSFFPQIIQGPIPRYHQLAGQLAEGHSFDYDRFTRGLQLILWGMMKKLIIADRLAVPVAELFDHYGSYHGMVLFFAAALYGIQVYTDFSGGMDIARGVSQVVGVNLELNFRQPYFSTSVEDFWRRWHITLGSWMKDYVFYPLSLSKTFVAISKKSRKVLGQFIGKRLPSFLAMFIVYFLVGFWHGPSWKYIAYGLWNGIFIVAGILLTDVYGRIRCALLIRDDAFSWKAFQMCRTFVIISLGRFFSRADGFRAALSMMKRMLVKWQSPAFLLDGTLTKLGLSTANWILILAALLVLLIVGILHEKGIEIRNGIAAQPLIFRWAVYLSAIVILLVFGMYGPEYNSASFIYGKF